MILKESSNKYGADCTPLYFFHVLTKCRLNLERVSIHSNFYSLGGDSIISIQIVSQANQAGIQLTVRDLLTYTTIHKLSEVSRKRNIHLLEGTKKFGTNLR